MNIENIGITTLFIIRRRKIFHLAHLPFISGLALRMHVLLLGTAGSMCVQR